MDRSGERVEHHDVVPELYQAVTGVGADETGAARYQNPHQRPPLAARLA